MQVIEWIVACQRISWYAKYAWVWVDWNKINLFSFVSFRLHREQSSYVHGWRWWISQIFYGENQSCADHTRQWFKCMWRRTAYSTKSANQINLRDFQFQKTIDILTLEKAYFSMTNTSLTSLHNYYKNEIIDRNRSEILKFKNTKQQYEKLVEESENIQKL